jgi:NAD(P)H-flavin reductase/hemoglobin-like flavoprotein
MAAARFAKRSPRAFMAAAGIGNIYAGANDEASENQVPESLALTDSRVAAANEAPRSVTAADLEPRIVKETFDYLMAEGPAAMEYFYARLFATSPDTRALFPLSMTEQRERVFGTLAGLLSSLDNLPGTAETLAHLGRDHRRFGVTEKHYASFFATLRDTAEHFIGEAWSAETAAAWQAALDFISETMRAEAALDARTSPPWWVAEIVGHELRSPGVGVLRLRPSQRLRYEPGQYVTVQVTRWPRAWRRYSIANAPRATGLIELHVRAVPGGLVSNSLVYHSAAGDSVVLGAAAGSMTLTDTDRDLLCVAGGTGLAPIKAIIEQALASPSGWRQRKITLFVGARQTFDLYDLEDLQLLELACPALRVIPVLSEEPGYAGLCGLLPEVIGGHGLFENTEAYICGPDAMVRQTTALLSASLPAAQIHYDPLP